MVLTVFRRIPGVEPRKEFSLKRTRIAPISYSHQCLVEMSTTVLLYPDGLEGASRQVLLVH